MPITPAERSQMFAQARAIAEATRAHEHQSLDQAEHEAEEDLYADLEEVQDFPTEMVGG